MTADLQPELSRIPAGEFLMGSDRGDDDERPAHRVRVAEFLMAVEPVTNAQYARFVRATSRRPPAIDELPVVVTAGGAERERAFRVTGQPYVWAGPEPPLGRHDHPVTLVRWDDAVAYCEWLSAETGRAFRLPTEAEWEKAARGGHDRCRFPWGDAPDHTQANFLSDPSARGARGTTPCRSFPANRYGLFDMAGNVWEWVSDWYGPRYYAASAAADPAGPPGGQLRIIRGGSWLSSDLRMLACSHRHKVPPDTYSYAIGFRVACAA